MLRGKLTAAASASVAKRSCIAAGLRHPQHRQRHSQTGCAACGSQAGPLVLGKRLALLAGGIGMSAAFLQSRGVATAAAVSEMEKVGLARGHVRPEPHNATLARMARGSSRTVSRAIT